MISALTRLFNRLLGQNLPRPAKIFFFVVVPLIGFGVLLWLIESRTLAVLEPRGIIAESQRDLMLVATLLMLIVVVPVFILTGLIAWRFRASNTKAAYRPDWDHHRGLELVWWTIPFLIILVLSIITWISSHQLDPYRPLTSDREPLKVRVVALQWKWLFIYPEQNIATVNYLGIPEDRPLNLEITADAPMNSFWIPQLGGQVYAMNGMVTQLHLMADEPGVYYGSSANISGEGFADMNFEAEAMTAAKFDSWIEAGRTSPRLDVAAYQELSVPSKDQPPKTYGSVEPGLYANIVSKYMAPEHHVEANPASRHHQGGNHSGDTH